MTREEKIKVLAELDGWHGVHSNHNKVVGWPGPNHIGFLTEVPPYLTSYDAIIPLIQKQPKEIRLKMFEEKADRVSIMTTPEQLADALIKAVGKWKD